tara:strand:+ start:16001 stop:17230 length:1230 start_codon:yes stop_codon:yes gene_type:complete
MPRQLPWLNKGAGSRTHVKPAPKAKPPKKAASDIDDDFFDGTGLASSRKDKTRVIRNAEDSDDELPDLPAEPSTPRTKATIKDASRQTRAASSSPPPIQDFIEPQIEFMRTGVSKFDLRDDEWMMVEDEFLETAKLFTRHLHIAEYKKLKERIEAKKKKIGVARPVVAGGKVSFEGKMKEKAKAQEMKQKQAIRAVFVAQNDEGDDDAGDASFAHSRSRQITSSSLASSKATTLKTPPHQPPTHDSDSEDLDTARSTSRSTTSKPDPASALGSTTTGPKSALPAPTPTPTSPSFAKPALPTKPRTTTSRRSRLTPFDMLDGYTPPAQADTDAQKLHSSVRSTSPIKLTAPAPASKEPARSDDAEEEWGTSSALRKATAERMAKRKAERAADRAEKRKTIKLEDIPTFLY